MQTGAADRRVGAATGPRNEPILRRSERSGRKRCCPKWRIWGLRLWRSGAIGFATGTAPKANGAGIAADPTLTDAWASVLAMLAASRLLSHSGKRLASDVWPLATCLATGAFGFRHRRSHRHPAFAPHFQRVDRVETFSSLTNGSLGRDCLPIGWAGQCRISGLRLVPPPVPARLAACPMTQLRALLKQANLQIA